MNSNDLITIASFGSPQEASIAKGLLESEGIFCFLMAHETAQTLWHVGTALGGTKLQVRNHDVTRAREILNHLAPTESDSNEVSVLCPNCGETVEEGFSVCWSCSEPMEERGRAALTTLQLHANSDPTSESSEKLDPITLSNDELALRAWRASVIASSASL